MHFTAAKSVIRLRIGPELRRWSRGVADCRSYMANLAAQADAHLEILPRPHLDWLMQ